MECLGNDVIGGLILILSDRDIANNTIKTPRGLQYQAGVIIHKRDDGQIKVMKNRWGNHDPSALPKELLAYVEMDNVEKRIIAKGW